MYPIVIASFALTGVGLLMWTIELGLSIKDAVHEIKSQEGLNMSTVELNDGDNKY